MTSERGDGCGGRAPSKIGERDGRAPYAQRCLVGEIIGGVRHKSEDCTAPQGYDDAGHWVGCAFTTQGQHMTYRLLTPPSQAPS